MKSHSISRERSRSNFAIICISGTSEAPAMSRCSRQVLKSSFAKHLIALMTASSASVSSLRSSSDKGSSMTSAKFSIQLKKRFVNLISTPIRDPFTVYANSAGKGEDLAWDSHSLASIQHPEPRVIRFNPDSSFGNSIQSRSSANLALAPHHRANGPEAVAHSVVQPLPPDVGEPPV